ncbi:DExH-box ATP-dependent RNA helicase DExH14 [Histomonas meleagridis]|uniref:DExH-box ATP-dependent RNA helicase DExH14 n=1 Tax=Histomonas meleagridis TaxID=135588 RepID=UPI00355A7C7D|nr:DExH-box ATP-dependent RNA helicase DExH14 [Histomonas meleagridis]KAH0802678.1 DExH-box ATP-dependent RNA helicase DExH14 [Histomonas meleagridis]
MSDTLPWRNTSIEKWLEDMISSCVSTTEIMGIKNSTKQLLLSEQDNDSLQFPLFELLGDQSFDVIESLLNNRAEIIKELQSNQSPSKKPDTKNTKNQAQKSNVPLSRGSRFVQTDSINAIRYDVEATTLERPRVDRVPIKNLPDWAQRCFTGCSELNDIQSTVYETAFHTNENMLICAPTGAGKTNVALLTILHELEKNLIHIPGVPPFIDKNSNTLIVYLTPMKALATEITTKFTQALKPLRVGVREYTGDTRISSSELERSQVLIATPEKWDVATRRSGEGAPCSRLTLLIIDEIHLLQDARGPVIEAIVARTLRQVEQTQSMIRIVGLSATLPNAYDVANFLKVGDNGLYIFGPEFRPVPLAMTLIGTKNTFKTPYEYKEVFEEVYEPGKEKDVCQIDIIALDLIKDILLQNQQVLVFVHTRGETARFANLLARHLRIKINSELSFLLSKHNLQSQLKECLSKGIGIHHAGLPRKDRLFVEKLFRNNTFSILICTATLAWGVNLPAHTVIIKDTKVYNHENGGFEDIGILDVHQMFGRAGRPQFDRTGQAILIGTSKVLPRYISTLIKAESIESKFDEKMTDFLNAEISLGTVTCIKDAINWIRYTFMYQRNPNDSLCIQKLDNSIRILNENYMIRTSIATESLQPTHLGQVASMHYIPVTAISYFNENFKDDMDESELLDCVFSSGIFDSLIVRQNELDDLDNFKPIIPLVSPVDEISGKVNVLFQSYVSKYQFKTPSLGLDQIWISDNLQRVFDAIFELCIQRGLCNLAMFSLNVCKMVEHQMCWFDYKKDNPLVQILKGNKNLILNKRIQMLDLTIDKLKNMNINEAKALLRSDQAAVDAINAARKFPCLNLGVTYQPMSDEIINLCIEVIFPFIWDHTVVHDLEDFWLFIQDTNGDKMYHSEEFQIDKRLAKDGITLNILVPISKTNSYIVKITSVRFLGVEDMQQINIKDADKLTFQKHLNTAPRLRPLNTNIIENEKTKALFPFKKFNLIQSQLFFQTYHTDQSLLLCAPTAAGKTVIAELAISRMLENNNFEKAVYLVPLKSIVQERVNDWKNKFGNLIIELTGDYTPDSESITKSRIIISTPEKWDAVSRGFIVRQFVQYVSLLILDEVHLLGTDRGHIIEAVVNRMKSINLNLRIIGLSTILSNPLDVGKFLGIQNNGIYNFSPSLRTVPLMTFIRGFPGKPTLVFVPSRRQTRLTALDLISYANTSGQPFIYVTKEATLASKEVIDQDLAHCLTFGVGLHHAGMLTHDLNIIEKLFEEGNLKLLIATSTLAWGVNLPAHFVIIKGTEYFDAKSCGFKPYTITELQQMMGRAGRPQFDKQGIVMIFCEESRKDFIKKFINSPFPVESSLLSNIYDHVNAEISNGRINSKKSLIDWINNTYFALRLNSNPKYYNNITIDEVADNTIQILQDSYCCEMNIDKIIKPTIAGKIGSIFYVSYKTIRLFMNNINNSQNIIDVLYFLCQSDEFKDVPIRHNEDLLIANMKPRYKCDGLMDSPFTKTYYMIQYYLSHQKMPIPDFDNDLSSVLDQILRIVGCYIEICAIQNNLNGMINAILIGQMITQGLWWDDVPFKTLINQKTYDELKKNNIDTLPKMLLMNTNNSEIQLVKDRVLFYKVSNIDINENKYNINIEINRISGKFGSNVISPHFLRKQIQSLYILIGDPDTKEMICHRRIQLKKDKMLIKLTTKEPIKDNYWIYLFADAYIGIDQMYSIAKTQNLDKLTKKEREVKKDLNDNNQMEDDIDYFWGNENRNDEEEESAEQYGDLYQINEENNENKNKKQVKVQRGKGGKVNIEIGKRNNNNNSERRNNNNRFNYSASDNKEQSNKSNDNKERKGNNNNNNRFNYSASDNKEQNERNSNTSNDNKERKGNNNNNNRFNYSTNDNKEQSNKSKGNNNRFNYSSNESAQKPPNVERRGNGNNRFNYSSSESNEQSANNERRGNGNKRSNAYRGGRPNSRGRRRGGPQ